MLPSVYFLILNQVFTALAVLPHEFHKQATINNAGHGFVAQLHLNDVQPELAIASVDGELLLMDLHDTLKTLPNWPIYLHKEHFLGRPIMYDINEDGMDDVVFISHSGTMYAYSTDAILLKQRSLYSLNSFTLEKHHFFESSGLDSFTVSETSVWCGDAKVCDFINSKVGENTSLQLRPEIFSSSVLADVDGDGRIAELLIPVNYISYTTIHETTGNISSSYTTPHIMVAAILLFDLSAFRLIGTLYLQATMERDQMPYLLSDITVHSSLDSFSSVTVVTTSSGKIFPIKWNPGSKSLYVVRGFPVVTEAPLFQSAIVVDGLVITADKNGHVYAWNINKGSLAWKYELPTPVEISPLTYFSPRKALYFATSLGSVYSLHVYNGTKVDYFPLSFVNAQFHAAGMRYHWMGEEYLAYLSTNGHLHSLHLDKTVSFNAPPQTSQARLGNIQSRSAPLLLRYGRTSRICILTDDGSVHLFTSPLHSNAVDHGQQMMTPIQDALYLSMHRETGAHSSRLIATGKVVNIPFTVYASLSHPDLHEFIIHVSVHGGPRMQRIYSTKLTASEVELVSHEGAARGILRIEMSPATTLRPFRGRVLIRMCVTKHYVSSSPEKHTHDSQPEVLCMQDSVYLRMNWEFLQELYGLLIVPFLVTVSALIINLLKIEAANAERLLPFSVSELLRERNK